MAMAVNKGTLGIHSTRKTTLSDQSTKTRCRL